MKWEIKRNTKNLIDNYIEYNVENIEMKKKCGLTPSLIKFSEYLTQVLNYNPVDADNIMKCLDVKEYEW